MKVIMQFLKFGIVGVSNTVIGLLTYYIFLCLGCHYMVANVVSWLISVLNAFYWNSRYVFKNSDFGVKALIKTYISYGLSFCISAIALFYLVEFIGISDVIAPIFVLFLTIPLNFIMNKFWTFK